MHDNEPWWSVKSGMSLSAYFSNYYESSSYRCGWWSRENGCIWRAFSLEETLDPSSLKRPRNLMPLTRPSRRWVWLTLVIWVYHISQVCFYVLSRSWQTPTRLPSSKLLVTPPTDSQTYRTCQQASRNVRNPWMTTLTPSEIHSPDSSSSLMMNCWAFWEAVIPSVYRNTWSRYWMTSLAYVIT